jgi:hypothetical protein
MRRSRRPFACVRGEFPDCMCDRCDPLLAQEAEAALALARWREENEPAPLSEAIDTLLSLIPARVGWRMSAERALVVMRAKGIRAVVVDGALRVPMELLPAPLREWLADPDNRAAVEDLLDEEAARGQRHEAA